MPRTGNWWRAGWMSGMVVLAIAALDPAESGADQLSIRGGGQLEGETVPIEERPGYVRVYTATGEEPFLLRREQIEKVVPAEGPLDEYLRRRKSVGPTAEDHHALGLWCEEQGLTGPAQVHYRRAVEIDEGFGPSHEKLGHVLWDGQWMTRDEVREAQGLVKFEGRWVTPEQREALRERDRENRAQQSWTRRIEILVKKYHEGTPAEQMEAERQFREIRDPAAIVPLVNLLGQEPPALRLLLAELLGGFPEPKATEGLVYRIIHEEDDQVRQWALNELARRNDPERVDHLIEVLSEDNPVKVGRAAWALAGLNAIESVPKLIPELVSVQRRIEMVMVPGAPAGAGGGLGLTARFSRFGGVGGPAPPLGGRSIAVLTGPAVAPGAVAFGAQAVPIHQYAGLGLPYTGSTVIGSGLSVGASTPAAAPPTPRPVVVRYQHQNVEVLAALERLTGENFGYDLEAWQRWLRNRFRPPQPDDRPSRRVPQP